VQSMTRKSRFRASLKRLGEGCWEQRGDLVAPQKKGRASGDVEEKRDRAAPGGRFSKEISGE